MDVLAELPWSLIWTAVGTIATVLGLIGSYLVWQQHRPRTPAQPHPEPIAGKLACCLGEMQRGGFTDLVIANLGSSPVSELQVFVNDVDLPEHSAFQVNGPLDRGRLTHMLRPGERRTFTFGILEAGDPDVDRIEVSWLDTDGTRRTYQTDLQPCGDI